MVGGQFDLYVCVGDPVHGHCRTSAGSLVLFHWSLSLDFPGCYLAEVKDTDTGSLSKSPLGREKDIHAAVDKLPVM